MLSNLMADYELGDVRLSALNVAGLILHIKRHERARGSHASGIHRNR